jgi:hypothetical protein
MLDKLIGFAEKISPLSPYIGMAGSLAGSLFSAKQSQASANRQMAFQSGQTGTGYQRAMADMKRAGLNPMLAAKLGPAASGSGAMAKIPDYGQTIASAENLRQQAPVRKAEAVLKEMQSKVADMQMYEIDERINKLQQEVKNLGLDFDLKGLEIRSKRLAVAMDEALMEKGGSVYMANKRPVLNTFLTSIATGAETLVDVLKKGFEGASAAGKRLAPEIKKGKQYIVEILSGE